MRGMILPTTLALATLTAAPVMAQSGNARPGVGDWAGPIEIRFERPAMAGQPVVALLPSDGCLSNGSGHPAIDPARTVIVRSGNTIALDVYASNPACFSVEPLGMWVYRQPLGAFAAGDYQITVRFRYHDFGNGQPFATLTAPLAVAGAATALDAGSTWSFGALVLALAALGIGARRRATR